MTFPPIMYGYCAALAAILCAGQILFKKAALAQTPGAFALGPLLTSPWFGAAVVLYGLSTVLWVYILSRMPLSLAYPFSLLGAALVPFAAYFLFGEAVGIKVWFGTALVLAGLYVMNVA